MDNRKITAEEVLSASGLKVLHRDRNNEIFFRCPNCGNPKGKLKCSVNAQKGLYCCFQCGSSGTLADLFSNATGFKGTRKEIWKEIRKRLGEEPPKVIAPVFKAEKLAAEAARASAKVIDKTYRTMLAFLTLKPEHKDNLLNRSLTEEEIVNGLFASMPTDRTGICRRLLQSGCTLEGVPGFFKNRRGDWELSGRPGYCCPAFQDGLIVGIQIRVDNPRNGMKYAWLSSSHMYRGVTSGSPFTYFGTTKAEEVIFTEGVLKAYVVYCMLGQSRAVLGVPGVNTTHDALRFLERMRPEIVYEAFDMDKYMDVSDISQQRKKEMLTKAKQKIYALGKKGIMVKETVWDKDKGTGLWLGNYKGLDDYLAATRR